MSKTTPQEVASELLKLAVGEQSEMLPGKVTGCTTFDGGQQVARGFFDVRVMDGDILHEFHVVVTEKNAYQVKTTTFDHSNRKTKWISPMLGGCVCEHCEKLPWHIGQPIEPQLSRNKPTK